MAKVNIKDVREHNTQMNDAWAKGAPEVEFSGIVQADFAADITQGATLEQQLADLQAQVDMKRTEIENHYAKMKADAVRVANGVRGDKNFGPDSALYGAMGFVRDSERASGLTRRSKNTPAS